MSGFCFLWDKFCQRDADSLRRLGNQALDKLSHPFASHRLDQAGAGWWLGICRGDGEPQISLATDAQGQIVVLLAGWLENYADLLADLSATAIERQRQPDDVDLLLALYQLQGPESLERLRGPLAALIWEPLRSRLTAVRDHLGESVICFVDQCGLLALASEEVALFNHPAVSKVPDFSWLGRFASRLPLPPGRTAFRDISELAPGELGEWNPFSFHKRWLVPADLPTALLWQSDDQAYRADWQDALTTGIPAATRRGRQFGFMLSGGMDSTTAAAFAVPPIRASGRKVAAYCWRFAQLPEADESAKIQAVAAQLGLEVNWFPGDDLYPILDPMDWPTCPNLPQMNPFLRLNLQSYTTARQAGCDVVLNGHFGDYLYPEDFHHLADALRQGRWQRVKQELKRSVRHHGLGGCLKSPEFRWVVRLLLKVPLRQTRPRFLAGSAREQFERISPWPPGLMCKPHPPQWLNLFGTTSAMEMKYELYFATRAGVERRHPLRHHRILQSVLALPSFLFSDPLDKQLTRDTMKARLPDAIIQSKRSGDLNRLFLRGTWGIGKPTLKALLTVNPTLWPEVIHRDYVLNALLDTNHPSYQQQRIVIAVAGMELWWRFINS